MAVIGLLIQSSGRQFASAQVRRGADGPSVRKCRRRIPYRARDATDPYTSLMGHSTADRAQHVRRGVRLEWFTIAYNSLEGLIALAAGFFSGSIALVGFGFDSAIEVTSGAALLWRLRSDAIERTRDHHEATALRVVG